MLSKTQTQSKTNLNVALKIKDAVKIIEYSQARKEIYFNKNSMIPREGKAWGEIEDLCLLLCYQRAETAKIKLRLQRTGPEMAARFKELGYDHSPAQVDPVENGRAIGRLGLYEWAEEELNILRAGYGILSTTTLQKWLNRTPRAIADRANKLDLSPRKFGAVDEQQDTHERPTVTKFKKHLAQEYGLTMVEVAGLWNNVINTDYKFI
jgi:hypothetical protein